MSETKISNPNKIKSSAVVQYTTNSIIYLDENVTEYYVCYVFEIYLLRKS